jgi:hypothetical protein
MRRMANPFVDACRFQERRNGTRTGGLARARPKVKNNPWFLSGYRADLLTKSVGAPSWRHYLPFSKDINMLMTADFATDRGAALMGTLGKHFGHKIPVDIAEETVLMHFEMGDARMSTTATGLHLSLDGADTTQLERMRDVVESHLLRFAHRQDPAPLTWSTPV